MRLDEQPCTPIQAVGSEYSVLQYNGYYTQI